MLLTEVDHPVVVVRNSTAASAYYSNSVGAFVEMAQENGQSNY